MNKNQMIGRAIALSAAVLMMVIVLILNNWKVARINP